ncbi:UNVERIFIED_CONTAM: hypothetical protein Slati_2192600 [Sesamum latifolium]|uniref:Disease resistance R13L4/SHOC-2-like LRR domain-containing protein n=1 Tax=Sesamum latifolium TaxID=2727402 RepID=A0AAW2WSB6_9LAMI
MGLDLFYMGLQGTIARDIGNLSFLTYLDLSNNSFIGLIPNEIGNLICLRTLNMSYNELSGHIPNSVGLLRNLQRLDLSANHAIGSMLGAYSTFSPYREFLYVEINFQERFPLTFANIYQN